MAHAHAQSLFLAVNKAVTPVFIRWNFCMDEKEAEARPIMGTIFLVYI